jgi:phage protein D|mmetsp:Transcript_6228/g.11078  ORF Transcript_6228/g.11078 Transcript_6228/m.11078 type:complete len:86 (-) Transcript_6228:311-568(-)
MLSTRFISTIRQSGCSVLKTVEKVSSNQVGGVSSVRVFSSATTTKDGSSWTTKSDIINAIAEEHDLSVAKSKRIMNSILDKIAEV